MTHRIAGVVLAAGEGRRFGGVKQLATFHGETLVRRALHAARDAGADPIIVVLGAHASWVAPTIEDGRTRIVVNDRWATGIASSVRAGIAAAGDADAVLITTTDQPLVDAAMLRTLMDAFDAEHTIVASTYDGVIGIPVVLGRRHLAHLAAALTGDRGAGAWLRARADDVTTIPLPAAEYDVDTIEALRALELRA